MNYVVDCAQDAGTTPSREQLQHLQGLLAQLKPSTGIDTATVNAPVAAPVNDAGSTMAMASTAPSQTEQVTSVTAPTSDSETVGVAKTIPAACSSTVQVDQTHLTQHAVQTTGMFLVTGHHHQLSLTVPLLAAPSSCKFSCSVIVDIGYHDASSATCCRYSG